MRVIFESLKKPATSLKDKSARDDISSFPESKNTTPTDAER
jgi:hypothetical protein